MFLGRIAEKEDTGILDYLKSVGLEALQFSKENQLSGGEKQRLAMLRVICNQHHILILDEPTGVLDIQAQGLLSRQYRMASRFSGILFYRMMLTKADGYIRVGRNCERTYETRN